MQIPLPPWTEPWTPGPPRPPPHNQDFEAVWRGLQLSLRTPHLRTNPLKCLLTGPVYWLARPDLLLAEEGSKVSCLSTAAAPDRHPEHSANFFLFFRREAQAARAHVCAHFLLNATWWRKLSHRSITSTCNARGFTVSLCGWSLTLYWFIATQHLWHRRSREW